MSKKDGNLPGHETDMSVSDFLTKRFRRIDQKVAGLLDYGYVPYQIAEMVNIPTREVERLMTKHGYVTVDRLPK